MGIHGKQVSGRGSLRRITTLNFTTVWDPTRQAWYFWNSKTQETTWENPLEKQKGGEGSTLFNKKDAKEVTAKEIEPQTSTAPEIPTRLTDEEVAEANGIDPDLAYLDPTLYASEIQQARTGKAMYSAAGAFDKRTGKFIPLAATGASGTHNPNRLSHANQADRQMGAFFDVKEYEEERKRAREETEREETNGEKRKRAPTKKELQRFKERAKEKKAAKYAWLKE